MSDAVLYECANCAALCWQALKSCPSSGCGPGTMRAVPAAGMRISYKRPDDRSDVVQLVRPLGGGGTATVFEASGEARAVVKLPRRDLFRTAPEQASLTKTEIARELQMLLRVVGARSEDRFHLAEFLGAGLLADGVPFLVMRFVDGRNLGDLIDEAYEDLNSYPSMSLVIGALLGAARGLRLLHANGILHRDIKPNNIVVPLGRPEFSVLVDLGTAKPESGEADLRSSIEIGPNMNRLYAAPEYVREGKATVATDLYAFGITAFEAFTGELPHERELAAELGLGHLAVSDLQKSANQIRLAYLRSRQPPVFPEAVQRRLPAALVDVILRLLKPDPSQRLASTDELVAVLESVACKLEGSGMLFRVTAQRDPNAPPSLSERDRTGEELLSGGHREGGLAAAPVAANTRRSVKAGHLWAAAAALAVVSLSAGMWLALSPSDPADSGTAHLAPDTTALRSERAAAVAPGERSPIPSLAARRTEDVHERGDRRTSEVAVHLVQVTIVTDPIEARVELGGASGMAPFVARDLRPADRLALRIIWDDGRTREDVLHTPDSDEVRVVKAPPLTRPRVAESPPLRSEPTAEQPLRWTVY